jgi:hypothetical protein
VAFCPQQVQFQVRISAEAAYPAAGGNDSVVRQAGLAPVAHEIANRAGGSWTPGHCCDVAVGGDPSDGNPSHDRQHAP